MRFAVCHAIALAAVIQGIAPRSAAAEPAAAATPSATPAKIFGYFDPKTHVFTPAPVRRATPANSASASPPAAISRSGTVNFTVTMTLKSTIPTNATFNTAARVGVSDPYASTPPYYQSSAANVYPTVTRNGSTLTITASVPYRFIYTVGTDPMAIEFYISYYGSPDHAFMYNQSIAVPANGATTAISLAGAL